jgi:hypothetical protein
LFQAKTVEKRPPHIGVLDEGEQPLLEIENSEKQNETERISSD